MTIYAAAWSSEPGEKRVANAQDITKFNLAAGIPIKKIAKTLP